MYSKEHAEFITVTCLEWKPVLHDDKFKDIIIDSLSFLTKNNRVNIYAFVIMSNHFHLIWQVVGEHKRDEVQRDFLKYTSQKILKQLHKDKSSLIDELVVDAKDRKHQVYERNSLGVPLWSHDVFYQKLDYIHNNPVKAGIVLSPEHYLYSSAINYAGLQRN